VRVIRVSFRVPEISSVSQATLESFDDGRSYRSVPDTPTNSLTHANEPSFLVYTY
jgi:hypothetical protein